MSCCGNGGTAKSGVAYQVKDRAGKVLETVKTLPEARIIRAAHGGTAVIREVPAK